MLQCDLTFDREEMVVRWGTFGRGGWEGLGERWGFKLREIGGGEGAYLFCKSLGVKDCERCRGLREASASRLGEKWRAGNGESDPLGRR